MKIDVAKHIVQLLEQNESIRVPGLGNFNLLHRSASFTSGKQAMVPPKVEVEFTEEIGEDDHLAKALKKSYGIKKKEANQAINVFSQKVLNNLLNLDRVRITGLGMLEKLSDGSISFKANKGFISQYYLGLPEVSTQVKERKSSSSTKQVKETSIEKKPVVTPVQKIEPIEVKEVKPQTAVTPKPVIEPVTKPVTKPAVSTETKTIAAAAAAAVTSSSISSGADKETTPPKKTWREIESEKLANKTQVKKAEPPVINYDDDDGGRGCLWPFIGLLALCLIGLFFFKYCGTKEIPNPLAQNDTLDSVLNHFDEDQSDIEAFEGDGDDATKDMGSKTNAAAANTNKSQPSNSNKAQVTEDPSLKSNPNMCIIITGVFNSQANTTGMSNHLKASGYVPYVERKGDQYRVGLKFDCRETDLKSFIRSIRRNIAKDAWYLQPSLRVD